MEDGCFQSVSDDVQECDKKGGIFFRAGQAFWFPDLSLGQAEVFDCFGGLGISGLRCRNAGSSYAQGWQPIRGSSSIVGWEYNGSQLRGNGFAICAQPCQTCSSRYLLLAAVLLTAVLSQDWDSAHDRCCENMGVARTEGLGLRLHGGSSVAFGRVCWGWGASFCGL